MGIKSVLYGKTIIKIKLSFITKTHHTITQAYSLPYPVVDLRCGTITHAVTSYRSRGLVAVGFGLVGAGLWQIEVVRLCVGHGGQVSAERFDVQARDLFVEFFWQ